MACACSSSTASVNFTNGGFISAPASSGGCTTATSSGRCVMPRRVATPSVTPVEFGWASQMRSLGDGKMVISNNCELANLDAPYDGIVWFDSRTGKVSVGPVPSIVQIADEFACTTDDLAGFPLYGLDPGCHDPSETPDRRIAAVRPRESSTAILFGHDPTCSSTSGSGQEMRPRHIIPATVPSPVPDNVRYLAVRVIPSAGECSPRTMQWYEPTEPLPYPVTDVPIADSTFSDLPDSGLAVWRVINGKLQLSRLTNIQTQSLLSGISPYKWVRPRPLIASSYGNATTGFIPLNTSVDLTTQPNYDAKFSTVVLSINLSGYSGARSFDLFVKIDGEEFARIKLGTLGQDAVNNQVHVPIPASKQVNIQCSEFLNVAGTYDLHGVEVYLDGWCV